MAGAQIQFLKSIIDKPTFVIKRDYAQNHKIGRQATFLSSANDGCYIFDIQEEWLVVSPGQRKVVNRVFVDIASQKSKRINNAYAKVGWILNEDLSMCMLCREPFSMFSYKHHCKACGSLVCQSCTDMAEIHEIRELGFLRVCRLCDYGQETVNLVPNHVSSLNPITPIPPPPTPTRTVSVSPALPSSAASKLFPSSSPGPSNSKTLSPAPLPPRSVSVAPALGGGSSALRGGAVKSPSFSPNSTRRTPSQMPAFSPVPSTIEEEPTDSSELDSDARLRRLSQFGAMTVVTPQPVFVLKTKRSSTGVKIFVNVCCHQSVPFKPEVTANIDAEKEVFFALSPPFEHQNEKDNSYCVIYDVVVSPQETDWVIGDGSGTARHRLCSQALELIHSAYKEELDPSYVILRLASNYKGRVNGDSTPVRPIYMPSSAAFQAQAQIPTVPIPDPRSESGKFPAVVPERNLSQQRSQSTSQVSSVNSSLPLSSFAPLDALQAVNKSLRCMALPREEMQQLLVAKNFNKILDAMSIYEMKLCDMVISPQPGFVILAQRVKPLRKVYVNVVHHPLVGIVTEQQVAIFEMKEKGNTRRPSLSAFYSPEREGETSVVSPVPFVIGKVDMHFADEQGNKAMIVDVVVPSNVFFLAMSDPDLKEALTVEVLQRLVALNMQLDANYAQVDHPTGYITSNPSAQDVMPAQVINLTEFEKSDFCVSFIGKLFKQGHRYKTWKERLFLYSDATLQYFDLKMIYQGEFPCEECSVEMTPPSVCSAPSKTYPFKLTNYSSGGEFLFCYTTDMALSDIFSLCVSLKRQHFYAIKSLINIPPMKKGWLKKQGHVVRNWKSRFFVLNYGVLTYYEKDGVSTNGLVEAPKGKLELQLASVAVLMTDDTGKALTGDDHRVCVTVGLPSSSPSVSNHKSLGAKDKDSGAYKLVLQMKDLQEKKEWFEAIRRHIEYAKEYNMVE